MKSKTYDEFVNKFKPKKTTDDCYTPDQVYNAVLDWVIDKYNIDQEKVLRPFWPGLNYQDEDYFYDCVVVDNPPFSIISEICEWYLDRNIKFFLFCPTFTALNGKNVWDKVNHIIIDERIIYENGASVKTSFVTNLRNDNDDDIIICSSPSLNYKISVANKIIAGEKRKQLPKYDYPDNVLTAAMMTRLARYGVEFCVNRHDCCRISALDSQRNDGKTIFGGGLLLSEKAATEKKLAEEEATKKAEEETAEEEAAIVWELSEREIKIIKELGHGTF